MFGVYLLLLHFYPCIYRDKKLVMALGRKLSQMLKPNKGLKTLFFASFCFSQGGFCYQRVASDKFHINTPLGYYGDPMYDDTSNEDRYK